MQVERRGTGHTSLFLEVMGDRLNQGSKEERREKRQEKEGRRKAHWRWETKMKRGQRMRDETREIRAENGSLEAWQRAMVG